LDKNLLVIGGTGMLKMAANHLIKDHSYSDVLGRNKNRLTAFQEQDTVSTFQIDYSNTTEFLALIENRIQSMGGYDTVLCWMHDSGKESLKALLKLLAEQQKGCNYYHILGSAGWQRPDEKGSPIEAENLHYNVILLGYIRENGYSRWLTNDEISVGTIKAYDNAASYHVIGQIEPWEQKP